MTFEIHCISAFLNIFAQLEYHWAFKQKKINLKIVTRHRVAVLQIAAKSHGQAEQGCYLVAHSCAARFVYLSASHFCSVKNGTLQFWNGILLYIGLYVAKFVFSLRLVPLPLVTGWRRKSVRR